MKKVMYFVLFCFSLCVNGLAAEDQGEQWNLDRTCAYTCRSTGEDITYRQLLSLAQERCPDDKHWAIVNEFSANFHLPVKKTRVLELVLNSYETFLDAERHFNAVFFKEFTRGMMGCARTEAAKSSEQRRHGFSGLVYDLGFALTILHVNSYNSREGNT